MAGSPRKFKPDSYTVADFEREFPTEEACLDWLWRHLHSADGETSECPKCERTRRFHRVKSRHSYSCDTCGHHVHPTAGTIFEKSTTPLRVWFHAVFILSQTRCGISAKQLQREVGVTYKTAWRMFNRIRRLLLDDDDTPLMGEVEIDETAWGGKIRASDRSRADTSTKASAGRHGEDRQPPDDLRHGRAWRAGSRSHRARPEQRDLAPRHPRERQP